MTYYNQFVHAIKRTEAWQLNPGDITLDRSVTYISEKAEVDLLDLFIKNFGDLPEEEQASCTRISVNILPLVRSYFCTDAYLTIGNVNHQGLPYYECTLDYLSGLLRKPVTPHDNLYVHSWITLSSGEIVDFTFTKGLSLKSRLWKPYKDAIVLGDPSKSIFELEYMPMVVGEDYLLKAGAMLRPIH